MLIGQGSCFFFAKKNLPVHLGIRPLAQISSAERCGLPMVAYDSAGAVLFSNIFVCVVSSCDRIFISLKTCNSSFL